MKKLSAYLLATILLLSITACTAPKDEPQQNPFKFNANGTVISLNADAAPVIAALGTPKSYTETASCAFEGLDKTYYYGSFYLSTYPLDGKDYVYSIWLVDDSLATAEGIRIGSTQQEVESAYGAECYNGTNAYIIAMADSRLTVLLTDGLVSSIQYEMILT